jgi:hypothetical protein
MQDAITSWTARGFYFLAVILVLFPLQELFVTVWPFRFGEITWRYAALGLAANFLYRSVAGLGLAIALAYWLDQRSVLRLAGVAALLLSALILPLMATFGLDLPAIAELRGEEGTNTLIAGGIQEVKYAATFLASGLLGWGALEMSRRKDAEAERTARGSPSALRTSAG